MKIEDHNRNIEESLEVIKESIQKGLVKRQRNIGFNVSAASVEMLEVFLHQRKLINPGANIKHDIFSSLHRATEVINFEFEEKDKIFSILNEIQLKRNILCYGKPQPENAIKEYLAKFNELRELFEKLGVKWSS